MAEPEIVSLSPVSAAGGLTKSGRMRGTRFVSFGRAVEQQYRAEWRWKTQLADQFGHSYLPITDGLTVDFTYFKTRVRAYTAGERDADGALVPRWWVQEVGVRYSGGLSTPLQAQCPGADFRNAVKACHTAWGGAKRDGRSSEAIMGLSRAAAATIVKRLLSAFGGACIAAAARSV